MRVVPATLSPMDYYAILGLPRTASAEEIKKAYRKLSKESHPDKHKAGDKAAEDKYKQINRAYEVLSDSKKKQMYDQFGSEEGPQFGGRGAPFGQRSSGFQGFEGDLGDMFETFFGGGRGARGTAEVQGRDMEVMLTVTLTEAFTGMRKTVRIRKLTTCEICGGSGGKAGAKKVACTGCSGTGQVTRTARSFFGVIQQSVMCDVCKGSGKVPEHPCSTCRGEGRASGSEDATIEVPPGIADGQMLRIRGKGEAGRQGTVSGDLFVHIAVEPDPRFIREGDDLHTEVTVAAPDAVLGADAMVPTLDGSVTLKVPEGTQPGQILRIRGKGMPVLGSSRQGDLYVKVAVALPRKPSRSEREHWEGLRGE